MENKPKIEIRSLASKAELKINTTVHHIVELENKQIDFFEQLNGNDCGACMLLNAQDALGVKDKADQVTNVKSMREWLSQHNVMGVDYRDYGSGGSWIQTGDMQQYIKERLGLQQKIIKGNHQNNPQFRLQPLTILQRNNKISFVPEVSPDELTQDGRNKFIWGVYNGDRNEHGGGNHYSGYLQTSSGVYLFDSLGHKSFQTKTPADLDDFIKHTVGDVNVIYGLSPRIRISENSGELSSANQLAQQAIDIEQSTGRIKIENRTDNLTQIARNAIEKSLK